MLSPKRVLIGAVVVAVVLVVSIAGAVVSDTDFPAWLEAISTLAAFIAATVAAVFAAEP